MMKFGAISAAVMAALGFGARATILQNTQHKDFYQTAMKEEQRIINSRKVMKLLNGKRSPEHYSVAKSLLHSGARYVSMYIGDKIGGPMGAVLGDMVGRHITRAVDRRHGKTIFETPAVRQAIESIRKEHPEYYTTLIQELEKHGVNVVGKGGLLHKAISDKKGKSQSRGKSQKARPSPKRKR